MYVVDELYCSERSTCTWLMSCTVVRDLHVRG